MKGSNKFVTPEETWTICSGCFFDELAAAHLPERNFHGEGDPGWWRDLQQYPSEAVYRQADHISFEDRSPSGEVVTPPADKKKTSQGSMRIPSLLIAALLAASASAAVNMDFDVPADEAPAASLTPVQVSGKNFQVRDPVHSDGLMHHYVVDSRFGEFEAYGRDELDLRLREIVALTRIAETSDGEVALKAVTRGIEDDVKSVVSVVKDPVGTVLGIPKGIGHLLGGYRARAGELADKVQHSGSGDAKGTGEPAANQAEHLAKKYIDQYMGLSKAERLWYAKLDIDPYTRNIVLRRAVGRLAKVDSGVSFGMKFVGGGVPYASEARRALDAIYNEDPAVLRKKRRKALAGFGLTAAEVERFENTLLLDPTRQQALVDAMQTLEGVQGREELLRTAVSVTSEVEAEVFLRSTRLLLRMHARRPVARLLAGVRLPCAQFADRRIVVFGAFDAVQWTAEVAGYEGAMLGALPADAAAREVWLSGNVSPRARGALEASTR